MAKPTPTDTHCVVYRTGTESACRWMRTQPMSATHAAQAKQGFERGLGYKAMIAVYAQSLAIGVPEGWEA